jgi:hypothetical protein
MREPVDHVEYHGEVLPVYPFFAVRSAGDTAFLEHEAPGVLVQFVIDGPTRMVAQGVLKARDIDLLEAKLGTSERAYYTRAVRQPDTKSA